MRGLQQDFFSLGQSLLSTVTEWQSVTIIVMNVINKTNPHQIMLQNISNNIIVQINKNATFNIESKYWIIEHCKTQ